MFFSANNNMIKDVFDIQLELNEKETENFESAVFTFSLGMSHLINELITRMSQTTEQATVLSPIVMELVQDMTSDYIEGGTFEAN